MAKSAHVMLSGTVPIEGAERFPHVMRRLREAFPEVNWQPGAAQADKPAISLVTDRTLPEGGFRVTTTNADGVPPHVTLTGGPFSGVIYAANDVITRGGSNPARLSVEPGTRTASPGLTYRTFWTWDHTTNWELSQIGMQEIGVVHPYSKPPSGFLADYRRLVDYCSLNRIAAVVIFGFLRNSHGGIEAGQLLCRYANERGVRILPGIAIGSYGGVYWEGDHPYNLATWLRKYPHCAAKMEKGVGFQLADLGFALNFPRSDYTVSACPSAPETMDWMTEATCWLAETFELGGINIESGDYGVCGCARCVARRADDAEAARRKSDHGDSWSLTDLSENFPRLFKAANAKRDDLWIYAEMQWDNLLDKVAREAQGKLPRGGIYQHTTNQSFWPRLKTELKRDDVADLPTQPNVLRCQFACQWNGDERTQRYALNARTFADMARFCSEVGMNGLTVWGEPSPYYATVELSYLAFARFSYEPNLTWERFMVGDVAPLLGGEEAAERFVAMASEIDAYQALSPARLDQLLAESRSHSGLPGEAGRRWLTLADQVARRRFMGR